MRTSAVAALLTAILFSVAAGDSLSVRKATIYCTVERIDSLYVHVRLADGLHRAFCLGRVVGMRIDDPHRLAALAEAAPLWFRQDSSGRPVFVSSLFAPIDEQSVQRQQPTGLVGGHARLDLNDSRAAVGQANHQVRSGAGAGDDTMGVTSVLALVLGIFAHAAPESYIQCGGGYMHSSATYKQSGLLKYRHDGPGLEAGLGLAAYELTRFLDLEGRMAVVDLTDGEYGRLVSGAYGQFFALRRTLAPYLIAGVEGTVTVEGFTWLAGVGAGIRYALSSHYAVRVDTRYHWGRGSHVEIDYWFGRHKPYEERMSYVEATISLCYNADRRKRN